MDNPVVWLLGLIVVLLITDAIIGVRKAGGLPKLTASVKAHDFDAVKDDLLAGLKSEIAALRQHFAQQQLMQPTSPAPAPTEASVVAMLPRYIDRDDLMKQIGSSGLTRSVTIDGVTVHNGFGPPLAYVKQPDGSFAIA